MGLHARRIPAGLLVALLQSLWTSSVWAQVDRPLSLPKADVTVTYRFDNMPYTACVTDDGIVLRLASKRPSVASLIAVDIHYGTPPDDLFSPPKGFPRERIP